jgi:hypothetical protein
MKHLLVTAALRLARLTDDDWREMDSTRARHALATIQLALHVVRDRGDEQVLLDLSRRSQLLIADPRCGA